MAWHTTSECIDCGQPLEKEKDAPFWVCSNSLCKNHKKIRFVRVKWRRNDVHTITLERFE